MPQRTLKFMLSIIFAGYRIGISLENLTRLCNRSIELAIIKRFPKRITGRVIDILNINKYGGSRAVSDKLILIKKPRCLHKTLEAYDSICGWFNNQTSLKLILHLRCDGLSRQACRIRLIV